MRAHNVERMRALYADCAPRTMDMQTHKLSQALNLAVSLGLPSADPIAGRKGATVDNRRVRFLSSGNFVRILEAAHNTDAHDLFLVMP